MNKHILVLCPNVLFFYITAEFQRQLSFLFSLSVCLHLLKVPCGPKLLLFST